MGELITAIAHLGQVHEGVARNDPAMALGAAYNRIFENLCPGDWCCLLDHDAMWTSTKWYLQLLQAIEDNPRAGLITAVTNRIGRKYQIAPDCPQGFDMREHIAFGKQLADRHGAAVRDITRESALSGVVMCVSHETWEAMGGFPDNGFFGVDNETHRRVASTGKRVLMMPGLYVFHWYRGDGVMHRGLPKYRRRVTE